MIHPVQKADDIYIVRSKYYSSMSQNFYNQKLRQSGQFKRQTRLH